MNNLCKFTKVRMKWFEICVKRVHIRMNFWNTHHACKLSNRNTKSVVLLIRTRCHLYSKLNQIKQSNYNRSLTMPTKMWKMFAGKSKVKYNEESECTFINWFIYSSFRDYLDCSEHVTRRACGAETGHFIRGFLNKMSSSLEKNYCEEYYKGGNNQCPNIFSSAISHFTTSSILKILPILLLAVNFLRWMQSTKRN